MEQVTVTGNENTRIEVVSISEIHQAIKTDEIPKGWSPLWSMDYSMMFASKAPVVWIYLMNLPTSIYISKPEPRGRHTHEAFFWGERASVLDD